MNVTCVHVRVKPEHVDDFIQASIANRNGAVAEPGNLRFDVLQRADDPCVFMLYEVYESDDAAAAHKQTPHYLTWRETVADWMAQPREGVKHSALHPIVKGQS